MGISIEQRKKIAIEKLRLIRPTHMDVYDYMETVRNAINVYVENGKPRHCSGWGRGIEKCESSISQHNRTGLCRKCQMRKFKSKGQSKRLEALRARYYRKRKKIEKTKELLSNI